MLQYHILVESNWQDLQLNPMKVGILLAMLVGIALSANWALLCAGSKSYYNYRHQADVFHAYQVLIEKGFDADHIITMAYDDIATATNNPFPGKIYNKPTYQEPGVDVYEGVRIDYKGADVTPANFLAVLEGDKQTTGGKKVIEGGPRDNVFIFFSDHGSVGLIAFPSSYLYADKLQATFDRIQGKYNKVVFYLETCESGSMFQKLGSDTRIYALSASSPSESSWGTYCSPDDVVAGKHVGSCLGDLFSVNFIEDTQEKDTKKETLAEQAEIVRNKTNRSKVMKWGDQSFLSDSVSEFMGSKRSSSLQMESIRLIRPLRSIQRKPASESAHMNSRTMKLQTLSALYARERSHSVLQEMTQEMTDMQRLDSSFNRLTSRLGLTGKYDQKNIRFECLRETVEVYEQKCGKFSDYGLQFVRNFAEACQRHSSQQILKDFAC